MSCVPDGYEIVTLVGGPAESGRCMVVVLGLSTVSVSQRAPLIYTSYNSGAPVLPNVYDYRRRYLYTRDGRRLDGVMGLLGMSDDEVLWVLTNGAEGGDDPYRLKRAARQNHPESPA